MCRHFIKDHSRSILFPFLRVSLGQNKRPYTHAHTHGQHVIADHDESSLGFCRSDTERTSNLPRALHLVAQVVLDLVGAVQSAWEGGGALCGAAVIRALRKR